MSQIVMKNRLGIIALYFSKVRTKNWPRQSIKEKYYIYPTYAFLWTFYLLGKFFSNLPTNQCTKDFARTKR
jgi:hypothetical protein